MKRSLFWLLDQYAQTGESVAQVHQTALDHATLADDLGFTSLWLAEHHFETLGTAPNPAVLLAAMAQRTETIRLGPAIAVLPVHNPILLAEDYALVDALSGGRLNMGVGSGSQQSEFVPFGLDFESRKEVSAKNLSILRERWRAASRGDVGSTSLNVAPVQSPTPPIYVATTTEQTAYQVGLAGDSLLTLVSPAADGLDGVAACVRAHGRGLEEVGVPDGVAEAVVMVLAHVAETNAEAEATAAPALARLLLSMAGVELSDAGAFYEQMRQNGVGLFGTLAEVGQQLDRFADIGVRHLAFMSRFGGMPRAAAERSLRLLAPGAA